MSDWHNSHALSHRIFKIIWSWHGSGGFIDGLWQQSREFDPWPFHVQFMVENEGGGGSRRKSRWSTPSLYPDLNSKYLETVVYKICAKMETSYCSAWKDTSLWGKMLLHYWLIVWFVASLVSSYLVLYLFICWFVSYLDSSGYAGLQHHFYDEQENKLIQLWFVASLVSSYLVLIWFFGWLVT
jgi:hypothetical protein